MVWIGLIIPLILANPADDDRIHSLPLAPSVLPSPQFSGFLNASAGCGDNGPICQVHYWFITAENATDSAAPLMLWFNGGPGASSIIGLFHEFGPLLLSSSDPPQLVLNPYRWTRFAHLLILESPVGVGYSYCSQQPCVNTDRSTAVTAFAALLDWYDRFPAYRHVDLYITGESYAGVYVPTLAYEIVQYNHAATASNRLPLVGIAVGDPCTDQRAQKQSMDPLWFGHDFALVDDAVYAQLTTTECAISSRQMSPDCRLAYRKYLLSSSRGISATNKYPNGYIDRYALYGLVSDVWMATTERYMNDPAVREALHIATTTTGPWTMHSTPAHMQYIKEFNACNHNVYDERTWSMLDFYRSILPQLPHGLWIYNGNTDPAIPFFGTRTAVKRLGPPERDGGGQRPWFYHHTATEAPFLRDKPLLFGADSLTPADLGIQMGGMVISYEQGVSFLTVHGAGHMVPRMRPQAAAHFMRQFTACSRSPSSCDAGPELAPLMPTNASLLAMDNETFASVLEDWTVRAKSAPYVDT
jgi:serine carboxypeptidase-like clade I